MDNTFVQLGRGGQGSGTSFVEQLTRAKDSQPYNFTELAGAAPLCPDVLRLFTRFTRREDDCIHWRGSIWPSYHLTTRTDNGRAAPGRAVLLAGCTRVGLFRLAEDSKRRHTRVRSRTAHRVELSWDGAGRAAISEGSLHRRFIVSLFSPGRPLSFREGAGRSLAGISSSRMSDGLLRLLESIGNCLSGLLRCNSSLSLRRNTDVCATGVDPATLVRMVC